MRNVLVCSVSKGRLKGMSNVVFGRETIQNLHQGLAGCTQFLQSKTVPFLKNHYYCCYYYYGGMFDYTNKSDDQIFDV